MFPIFYFPDCSTHKNLVYYSLEEHLSSSMSSVLTHSFSPEEKDNYLFILLVYYISLILS